MKSSINVNTEVPVNVKSTLEEWEEIYISIKATAIAKEWKNTLIALSLAIKLHDGQFRKGGEPYIIHPLQVCKYLISLKEGTDIRCAAALLHDVAEDCDIANPTEVFVKEYGLASEIAKIVLILTKPKNYKKTDPTEENYYEGIKKNKDALLIKISDRANNLSTVDAFTKEKMIKYVDETKRLVYGLCRYGKEYYPEHSNAITIMKYQIQSICETIESLFDISTTVPNPLRYRKTFIFLRDYSIGKEMENTQKAVFISNKFHKDDTRSNGEPFILHPLRVCSYLIALKVNDDVTCAAALLHEIIKMDKLKGEWLELFNKENLDPEVLNLVKLYTKPTNMSIDEYYDNLKKDIRVIMVRLSNRAHTCTRLSTYTKEEKIAYIFETKKYIADLCTYAQETYPKYWDQIEIMKFHIFSICRIVESLEEIKTK